MQLIASLKDSLRDTALHRWVLHQRDQKALKKWALRGYPLPPPSAYKLRVIREMAKRFGTRVLVETGTQRGNTIAASLGVFDMIYSVELSKELYEAACRRFSRRSEVKLRHGDSGSELGRILEEQKGSVLFWLDAHWSGENTARGDVDTPIVQELEAISKHPAPNHVILIDDARCFDGTSNYPTIEFCRVLAAEFWPHHEFSVVNDIIRIVP